MLLYLSCHRALFLWELAGSGSFPEGRSRMNLEKEQKTDVFVVRKPYSYSLVRCHCFLLSSSWDKSPFCPSSNMPSSLLLDSIFPPLRWTRNMMMGLTAGARQQMLLPSGALSGGAIYHYSTKLECLCYHSARAHETLYVLSNEAQVSSSLHCPLRISRANLRCCT